MTLSTPSDQRRTTCITLTLLLGLATASPGALAWWDLGHSALCDYSLTLVAPDTRVQIDTLLGIQSTEHLLEPESFGRACTWADRIKRERKDTAPWHYLNAPPGSITIAAVEHPEQGDIMTALAQQTAILGDASASNIERAEALRWVGHLVGDLHQPMHLGYESDWGGNKYTLSLSPAIKQVLREDKRDKTNMHAVWDGYLLIYAMGAQQSSLSALIAEASGPRADNPTIDPKSAADAWANEVLALLNRPEVRYATEHRLSALKEDYLQANHEYSIDQLAIAATRLAHLLDLLLTGPTSSNKATAQQ